MPIFKYNYTPPGFTESLIIEVEAANLTLADALAAAKIPVGAGGSLSTGVLYSVSVLSNVDNTSDSSKPVSSAQAAADAAVLASAQSYANSVVIGLWDDRGNFTPSGNYPATGGSGTAGAILKGDIYTISGLGVGVTATMGSKTVKDGDTVRSLIDTPGNTDANWAVAEGDLGYTPLTNTLASAKIYVGSSLGVATAVDVTGDATISNAGVIVIGNLKVTNAMLAGSIDLATKVIGILPGANGGTGVANTGKTITLAGNIVTTGAFNTTFAQQATVTLTLPTATSTLLANNLGITGGSTIIGGTAASDPLVIRSTSNATKGVISTDSPVSVPVGAVGAPTLTFIGDLDTGYYHPGAGQIGIAIDGSNLLTFLANTISLAEATNFSIGTTTGSKIGTSISQKIGFWNVTPIIQPASANQAAVAAQTQDNLTDSTGGTANTTLVDVGLLFNQNNINNNFADCAAQLAKVKADIANMKVLQNQLRTDLIAIGLIKGAA